MADYNFKEMQDIVGRWIQDTSPGRQTRIQEAINLRYLEIAKEEKWTELNEFELNLTTLPTPNDNGILTLPKRVGQIYKIIQADTPEILQNIDFGTMLEQRFFLIEQAGKALDYSQFRDSPIKDAIATAEIMDLVSSSASDTSGITVIINGRVGDDPIRESVAINGTTTVQTTNLFTDIHSIGVEGSRVGIITISGASSSTEYSTIAPIDDSSRYAQLRVFPKSAAVYHIFFKRRVYKMDNDADVPEIPIGTALIQFAIADILRQQHRDQGALIHERRGAKIIRGIEMQKKMQAESIELSKPLSRGRQRTSPVVVNNTN